MQRIVLLFVGLVVAALLGVFLVLQGDGDGNGERGTVALPGGAEPGSADPSASSDLTPAPGSSDTDSVVRMATPGAGTEVVDAGQGQREDVRSGRGRATLCVVTKDGRRPLPGAEVYLVGELGASETERWRDYDQVDDFARAKGRHLVADAKGCVRFDPPEGNFVRVVGAAPGLWGRDEFSVTGDTTYWLELDADATLRVQVVDERGRPQLGAGVVLSRHHAAYRLVREERLTGGAQALAEFRHAQRRIDAVEGVRWAVELEALLATPVLEWLEPEALPTGIVRLVQPATGSVVVHVEDLGGEPLEAGVDVTLRLILPGEGRERSAFQHGNRIEIKKALANGRARFDFVDTPFEFEVAASVEGALLPTRAFLEGPRSPGETVETTLRLGSDHPVLVFRAVTTDGDALGGAELQLRLTEVSELYSSDIDGTVETARDGTFVVDVTAHREGASQHRLVVCQGDWKAPILSAEVALDRKLVFGRNDMGDLVLRAPVAFVSGRVVDRSGAAMPAARLHLRRKSGDSWQQVYDFEQHTDATGEFSVAGSVVGEAFQLYAKGKDFLSETVEFVPGGEVTLVVQRTGSLAGSVLLDDELDESLVQVRLERGKGSESPLEWSDTNRGLKDGVFVFEGLPPGAYDVGVWLQGDREALRRIEDVWVADGSQNTDGRLQNIDLRNEIHSFRLTLEGTGDEPVSGNARYAPAGSEVWQHRYFEGSEVTLLARTAAVDVLLDVKGYRLQRLEDLRGDRTLTLAKNLRVRVLLTGDAELPGDPYFVKVSFVRPDNRSFGILWGAAAFDERREVVVEANTTGTLEVRWLVERRRERGGVATTVDLARKQTVEIFESSSEQTVSVSLSREEMKELLAVAGL